MPARHFDTEPGNPIWTNEGTRVMFVAASAPTTKRSPIDVTTGQYTQLTKNTHDQRHVGQQGWPDHRVDDGRTGFGDRDLRHRSVVRQPTAAHQHEPAAGRDRAGPDRSDHVEEQRRRGSGGRAAQAGRLRGRQALPDAGGRARRPGGRVRQRLPPRRPRGRTGLRRQGLGGVLSEPARQLELRAEDAGRQRQRLGRRRLPRTS